MTADIIISIVVCVAFAIFFVEFAMSNPGHDDDE